MKSVPKLIRRFVGILFVSTLLLLGVNLLLLLIAADSTVPNDSPYKTARAVAGELTLVNGRYRFSLQGEELLEEEDAWAMLIADESLQVVWRSENLPGEIPGEYTLADIAEFTRGYLKDYPTYTAEGEGGLMVVGFPRDRYWKHLWPSWDMENIQRIPVTILTWIICNVLVILLIYVTANGKIVRSVRPIVEGIQALAREEQIHVPEKGLLSEIAASINRTSDILWSKNREIRRKDRARANWIAGVSHDIRTPLSMVMGHAARLEQDPGIGQEAREEAAVIRRQSERMKNLINDLNLASKMEYNMQPVKMEPVNAVALVRKTLVDFMNTDIEGKYPVVWETEEELTACMVEGDQDLLSRAVFNLIQNCVNHNRQGCGIYGGVELEEGYCRIHVDDDGVGADDGELERLKNTPHYMVCDENTREQRHGLGLLIVRQIARAHKGWVEMGHSGHGGFSVRIILPVKRS